MKYAVQYVYEDWGMQVLIDTAPISKKEAIKIFNENLEDFRSKFKSKMKPELAIWKDVGDGEFPSYRETLVHLDSDCEIAGDNFYVTKRKKVELPK